jgi:uronate dehydrogenase
MGTKIVPAHRTRVLVVTGAAGAVGRALRPLLAPRFDRVVLTDVAPLGMRSKGSQLLENERFVRGDCDDRDFVRNLLRECVDGVSDDGASVGVLHLGAAVGASLGFAEVLGPNIVAVHHVLEACRDFGVRQVVLASSHHAAGFAPRPSSNDEQPVADEEHSSSASSPVGPGVVRPDSEYAASKVYAEALGSLFADKYGLNVLSIRVGFIRPDAIDGVVSQRRRLATWVSPRDLAQLVLLGLDPTTHDAGHTVVYGVSGPSEGSGQVPFFDTASALALGFAPRDRATLAADAVAEERGVESAVVGGGFAREGFAGDLSKVLRPRL